jgi:hypothetical protein
VGNLQAGKRREGFGSRMKLGLLTQSQSGEDTEPRQCSSSSGPGKGRRAGGESGFRRNEVPARGELHLLTAAEEKVEME